MMEKKLDDTDLGKLFQPWLTSLKSCGNCRSKWKANDRHGAMADNNSVESWSFLNLITHSSVSFCGHFCLYGHCKITEDENETPRNYDGKIKWTRLFHLSDCNFADRHSVREDSWTAAPICSGSVRNYRKVRSITLLLPWSLCLWFEVDNAEQLARTNVNICSWSKCMSLSANTKAWSVPHYNHVQLSPIINYAHWTMAP